MHISKVAVKNFRLLKDSAIDLKTDHTLLVGKNNSGKTSLLVLFEKFYENQPFNFNDFSLSTRKSIYEASATTDINDISIQLFVEVKYDENDDLKNISNFILDLDPSINTLNILFECSVNTKKLLEDLALIEEKDRIRFIEKNLSYYLQKNIFAYNNKEDLKTENRYKIFKKDLQEVRQVINFQIIHAKRDVASSEGVEGKGKVLSALTTKYYNHKNKGLVNGIKDINELIFKLDKDLDASYSTFFKDFLSNAKKLLKVSNLKVTSNLEANQLLENASKIVYGENEVFLPEHLNGLGYMNILFLLLNIEIARDKFLQQKANINLLFLEEPEAHTHPQMQYIFSDKIIDVLEGVSNLQTVITTHSAHIVSQWKFDDIRYLLKIKDATGENVVIKNLDTELEKSYTNKEQFKFLKQYLTIQSSELFFADKVIFIEGTSERILLPLFIKKLDEGLSEEEKLGNQNISTLEVGANAKVFEIFLDFLSIKTLVITDIDTTKKNEKGKYTACSVEEGTHTSNYTLKHYFKAPEYKEEEKFKKWMDELKQSKFSDVSKNIKISYQSKVGSYHARSFEDAFVQENIENLKTNKDNLWGLSSTEELSTVTDYYKLVDTILEKKSDFASSVLYLSLSSKVDWNVPSYIKEGLKWLAV